MECRWRILSLLNAEFQKLINTSINMSGWLDYFEVEVIRPFCKSIIEVTIWEDGELNRNPEVISGLKDGEVECSVCKSRISDEILEQNSKKNRIIL